MQALKARPESESKVGQISLDTIIESSVGSESEPSTSNVGEDLSDPEEPAGVIFLIYNFSESSSLEPNGCQFRTSLNFFFEVSKGRLNSPDGQE